MKRWVLTSIFILGVCVCSFSLAVETLTQQVNCDMVAIEEVLFGDFTQEEKIDLLIELCPQLGQGVISHASSLRDCSPSGDANGNGVLDVSDISLIVNAIINFENPNILNCGDANNNGVTNVHDIIYIANFILGYDVVSFCGDDQVQGFTEECESNSDCTNTETCMNCQCVEIHEPDDTQCSSNSQNGMYYIPGNQNKWSCQVINVVSDNVNFLDYIVDDAIDCCTTQHAISVDHWEICESANSQEETNNDCISSFIGIGLEDTEWFGSSLGNSNPWIQNYYMPELCCYGGELSDYCTSYEGVVGECSPDQMYGTYFNDYVLSLTCSDYDCQLKDQPAIHTAEVLNTGTCVEWSYLTTSLLRKAGVPGFSVSGYGHFYNLVWRDDYGKWVFMDYGELRIDPENEWYDYCDFVEGCYDENSAFSCSSSWINQNVYGCSANE